MDIELIEFPNAIRSLDEAVFDGVDCRACYEPAGDIFVLRPYAVEQIEAANASLKAPFEARATKIAEQNQKIARDEEQLHKLTKRAEIKRALAKGGCPPEFQEAVTAILMAEIVTGYELIRDGAGIAEKIHAVTPYGPCAVELAVNRWLASKSGTPFARKQPTVGQGEFSAAIERLKHAH